MILGISSFAFGWSIIVGDKCSSHPINELDLVKSTVAHGLQCLQIGDNLPLHTSSETRLYTLKHLIYKHGIRLEVGARKLTAEIFQRYNATTEDKKILDCCIPSQRNVNINLNTLLAGEVNAEQFNPHSGANTKDNSGKTERSIFFNYTPPDSQGWVLLLEAKR